jgi:Ca-activated chloride channel family protein
MYWTHPHILLGLWILPLVAGLLVYAQRKRAAAARRFAEAGMVGRLMPAAAGWRPWVKGSLLVLGLASLIVAGARPRFGVYLEEVSQQGADLVVLLDVSRSMTAEDVLPNRLGRAKSDIGDLLTRVVGDRVGLVVFAGKPVLKVPLTTDQGFFRMVLDEVGPHSAPRGGTLIGDGIRKCLDILPRQRDRDQAIVLITDGEDQQSYPEEAAKQAAERGVKIFAVGLGDARQGALVPVAQQAAGKKPEQHRSKLDEGLLKKIALMTGGAYIPAGTRVYDLGQIYAEHLAKLARGQIHAEKRKRYREQFQLFVALGLALLLIEMAIARYPRPSRQEPEPETVASAHSHLAGGLARRAVPTIAILLTLASPAAADPGPAEKVREGIRYYHKGNYSGAATAFREAEEARPDDLRITFDRACALAASGDGEKAADLFQKTAVSRDPDIAAGSRYNLGNLAAAKGRAAFGKNPEDASPEVRQEGTNLLLEAVGHYRDCLELAPEHADARHNLELIRLWLKHMEALWRERDRQKEREETSLLDFLAMLDRRQRALRKDAAPLAVEPDSPKRRQALATIQTSQRELAEEIKPLKQKLAEAIQPKDAHGKANPALDHFTMLADRAHEAMTTAADRLAPNTAAKAAESQAEAVETLDQIYLGLVPFVPLLQRALKDEQELADQVEAVAADEKLQETFDFASSAWEQEFFARWSEALPVKAEHELKQREAAPPPAAKPDDEKAAEEAKNERERVKQALKKAIEFGPQKLRQPAAEAATLLRDKKPAEAAVQQKESLKLLQEIADLLPKQNQQDQNQQDDKNNKDDKKDKSDSQQNEKQQDQRPQQNDKKDKKPSPSKPKPQPSKQEDLSKQQAEAVFRKVRQRQQYRRDMERRLQQWIAIPDAVEKDW